MSKQKNQKVRNSIESLDPIEQKKRRRERFAIGIILLLIVSLFVIEFRLGKFSSTLPFVNSIFFFGLLNLNLILILGLFWLIFRNISKLFIERRRKILGAKLKTKLVISFLAFSIVPTLVLFAISALYITSSFDKWFSLKIQNTLEASIEITRNYYEGAQDTGLHFANHISERFSQSQAYRWSPQAQEKQLKELRELLSLDSIEYYTKDPLEDRQMVQRADLGYRVIFPKLSFELMNQVLKGEVKSVIQHTGTGDVIRCFSLIKPKSYDAIEGFIVVNKLVPRDLVKKVDEISTVMNDYREINPLKYPVKTAYFVILVLMTLVILSVAIWIGLYLARELTMPLERLVSGAERVGSGDLDHEIKASGHDEISQVISAFNQMIHDLRDHREKLSLAQEDSEQKRVQLEAILKTVSTGVFVVDSHRNVVSFNPAAGKILGFVPEQVIGKALEQVLIRQSDGGLLKLIQQSLDVSSPLLTRQQTFEWNISQDENLQRQLLVVASTLEPWGVVVVIDDLTPLMKEQREMAWREVARRIAHEIKNPLTPIKLSAQRLQRRLGQTIKGPDGELLKECTQTIITHTDELKELVNEFSNFARLPEIHSSFNQLNEVCSEVLSLYIQAHPQIEFKLMTEPKLPGFYFDRDQIKRVLINLLENAIAAVSGIERPKKIQILTHYHEELGLGVFEVQDNGKGMPEEVKSRIFEPYFSTKSDGTGLGLAIAKRIVNDHQGVIRAQSLDTGTQFWIEIPIKK